MPYAPSVCLCASCLLRTRHRPTTELAGRRSAYGGEHSVADDDGEPYSRGIDRDRDERANCVDARVWHGGPGRQRGGAGHDGIPVGIDLEAAERGGSDDAGAGAQAGFGCADPKILPGISEEAGADDDEGVAVAYVGNSALQAVRSGCGARSGGDAALQLDQRVAGEICERSAGVCAGDEVWILDLRIYG